MNTTCLCILLPAMLVGADYEVDVKNTVSSAHVRQHLAFMGRDLHADLSITLIRSSDRVVTHLSLRTTRTVAVGDVIRILGQYGIEAVASLPDRRDEPY